MPVASKERQLELIDEQWVPMREPKSIGKVILLSIPIMILNAVITLLIINAVSQISLRDIGIYENYIFISINVSYIIGILLLLIIHELMHLILIPNFIKSDKTFVGITSFGGYAYSEEVITRSRYILITITPFIIISIILPLILGILGHLSTFMKFCALINAMGSAVDVFNLILILHQVPSNSSLTSNGMDTYWKSN